MSPSPPGSAHAPRLSLIHILREIRTYRKLIAGIWPYEVGQPLTDWDRKRLDILIRFLDFDIVYPLLLDVYKRQNGAGKTTLFNAIKICLYGCVAYGFESNNAKYFAEIEKIINANEKLQKIGEAEVVIDLLMDDGKRCV